MNVLLLTMGLLLALSFGAHTMTKESLNTSLQKSWHGSYLATSASECSGFSLRPMSNVSPPARAVAIASAKRAI